MGRLRSRVLRTVVALLLSTGSVSAQLPVSQAPAAAKVVDAGGSQSKPSSRRALEAARDQADSGSLLEAREQYLRLLRESREKTAAAESAAARAAVEVAAAQAELAALEARLAYVSLLVQGPATADTRVTCDGQVLPVGSLGVPLPLLPGRHEFRAFSTDLESPTITLTLEPGAVEMVSLTLPTPADEEEWPEIKPSPFDASAPAPAPAPLVAKPQPRTAAAWTDRPYLIAAWASVGVAALSFGAGSYWAFSGASSDRADALYADCQPRCSAAEINQIRLLDDGAASSARTRTIAAFTLGGVGLATAGALFFLDQKRESKEQASRLTPIIGLGYAGVNGRF
jgi:hypothetical protein